MQAGDYARLTGSTVTLQPGQVLADGLPEGVTDFTLGGVPLTVAGPCETFPAIDGEFGGSHTVCLVVSSQSALADLTEQITPAGDGFVPPVRWFLTVNPAALDDRQTQECAAAMQAAAQPLPAGMDSVTFFTHSDMLWQTYSMNGSFLFLGVFLAVMFTVATVLIIYYKQLSEGYEDRSRFLILQQVGMSTAEVRATIRVQVLMIFFLPLVMAAIHLAAAFPMLMQLISSLGVADQSLFIACCVVTLAAFAVCYVAVYLLTARKYYSIVKM